MFEYKINDGSIGLFEAECLKATCVLEDLSDLFAKDVSREKWGLYFLEKDRIYWKLQIIDDALARILKETQKISESAEQ